MIGMSIGDPDAPGQPPEIMLAMATCMQALAALPEPTAENVLRCVHLVVLSEVNPEHVFGSFFRRRNRTPSQPL